MKCPKCGHWNRASFPRCFQCGEPLPAAEEPQTPVAVSQPARSRMRVDEDGNASYSPDPRDVLAADMQQLRSRKARGEYRQRLLREESARRGDAPSGRSVQTYDRQSGIFPPVPGETGATRDMPVDYDDYENTRDYRGAFSRTYVDSKGDRRYMTLRQLRGGRRFGARRFTRVAAILLLLFVSGFFGYRFVYPAIAGEPTPPLQERVEITSSLLSGMAAHTVRIPESEGTQIYIKELKKSYLVTGGYATVQVADYTWYETMETIQDETMRVTLTPYIKTSAGEQKPMEQIFYDIDIPLSPLTLITPDVGRVEVSTPLYNIKIHVEQNSTVFINDENLTDMVNTQDGYINYNAPVQAIGDNVFTIRVKCQYYRDNSAQIVIYRAPQDIPLDLSGDIATQSSEKEMLVKANTRPGAAITILSPNVKADMSQLATSGSFSFHAVFNTIGYNTISIQAEYPGKETTLVEYPVYYLPPADDYTPKAWAMDAFGYSDFLAMLSKRVADTQIYVCKGTIEEIVSPKPQLAIMTIDDSGGARQVMLENMSSIDWAVGEHYHVYADAYGLYNAIPRLVGRYTYRR